MRLAAAARAARAAAVAALDTALFAPPAVLLGLLLGPTHPAVSGLYRGFAGLALRLGFASRVRSNGDAHLDPGRGFVFASNHQSHLDALAIVLALRRHPIRFVAKQELARIPLFGQALRATGNVFVARSDTGSDLRRLDDAHGDLRGRVSVLFFAEGTRSRDGRLGPFKKGAAVFALKTGLPLVPVGVHGSFQVYPRGLRVHPGRPIGVSVGAPVDTRGFSVEQRGPLTERLRAAVAAEIERARALAAEG